MLGELYVRCADFSDFTRSTLLVSIVSAVFQKESRRAAFTKQLYKHHARARASRKPPAAGAGQFVHKYLPTYIDKSTYDVCTIHNIIIFYALYLSLWQAMVSYIHTLVQLSRRRIAVI